ncbi:MAG: hypothetical protein H7141_05020 [Burkholderiales bacterium]|nr:hypothetical protein [Bacteroidia bacterium]
MVNKIDKIILMTRTYLVSFTIYILLLEMIKSNFKLVRIAFFASVLILVLGSCSSGKFLNRKYTFGKYNDHKQSLVCNTTFIDSTKYYASLNDVVAQRKTCNSLDNIFETDIINAISAFIIKKDSIWISKRRGRDRKKIKKCSSENVTIILTKPGSIQAVNLAKLEKEYYQRTNTAIIGIKRKGKDRYVAISEKGDTIECKNLKPIYKIKDEQLNKLAIESCNKRSYKAMSWSILSFVGLALSIIALVKIKKTKRKYENVYLKEAKSKALISLTISIITTLCFFVISAIIINYLLLGIGAAVTPGR